jgi:nitrogen fixation protein FixH
MSAALENGESLPTGTASQGEGLARLVWTLAIVSFFALQAMLWLVAIALTATDPSFAVPPNYERESENWNAVIERRKVSRELGWRLEFQWDGLAGAEGPKSPGRGERSGVLLIRVVDRDGQPVTDANVELELFHCARAAERQYAQVTALDNGSYAAAPRIDRGGWWRLSGVVRRGGDEFYFDQRQQFDVPGAVQ